MYKKIHKIPTIIALLILLIGIGGGIYLIENFRNEPSKAKGNPQPLSVQITNLSDTSFSLIWITSEPSIGSIIYGNSTNSINNLVLDDRDIEKSANAYLTHHVTVRNLNPQSDYFFSLISADKTFNNGEKPFSVKTAAKLDSNSLLEPAYGQVLTSHNEPAEGAIVILTLPQSLPLSTIVKPSGNWLIPLNKALSEDLKPYILEGTAVENILVFAGVDEQSQATTDIKNDSPVPPITIGKTYDFRGLQGKKKSDQQLADNQNQAELGQINRQEKPVLGQQVETLQKKTTTLEVFVPEDQSTFVSTKPLFRGKATPNNDVLIEIQSTNIISGKTKADRDGVWSWISPSDIPPGKHTVKFSSTDELGKSTTLVRSFLVFKSGTQVLGEATPSGTLTPTPTGKSSTPTPSPTGGLLTPTITPTVKVSATPTIVKPTTLTPTPTGSVPPVAGNFSVTIYLLAIGTIIFSGGLIKLLKPSS